MEKFRVVGINFDHMHMGDLLRQVQEHPAAEIVGICDEQPERMATTAARFAIGTERIFTDYRQCLEVTILPFSVRRQRRMGCGWNGWRPTTSTFWWRSLLPPRWSKRMP